MVGSSAPVKNGAKPRLGQLSGPSSLVHSRAADPITEWRLRQKSPPSRGHSQPSPCRSCAPHAPRTGHSEKPLTFVSVLPYCPSGHRCHSSPLGSGSEGFAGGLERTQGGSSALSRCSPAAELTLPGVQFAGGRLGFAG